MDHPWIVNIWAVATYLREQGGEDMAELADSLEETARWMTTNRNLLPDPPPREMDWENP